MNLHISITGGSALLQKAISLTQNRAGLNLAAITEVQQVTEAHLRRLAATRHDSARALGASPSNHLARAAESVSSPDALSSGPDDATLTINYPGIGRALHDVTITPKTSKSLAIPVNALAYARRPREIWERYNLFIAKTKSGRGMIFAKGADGKPVAMYLLVRSVTQKQDRTLLPSEAEFSAAANLGARRFFAAELA